MKRKKKKEERGERGGGIYTLGVRRGPGGDQESRKYLCTWDVLAGTPHFSTSPLQLSARQVQPTFHDQ